MVTAWRSTRRWSSARQAASRWSLSSSKEATSGSGHHEVAPGKAAPFLHPALLVTLARRAEVALEQVVAAKGDEGPLLLAVAPFQDPYCTAALQVVVAEPLGDAIKVVKGQHMPFEEGFLLLRRIGSHKQLPGVAQAHEEQLHGHLLTGDDSLGFCPVHLGIHPRIKLQGHVHRARFLRSRRRWPM